MPNVIIYHNPQCAKSRETLELIRSRGIEPHIIEYMKTPLTIEGLLEVLNLLQENVMHLFRENEPLFKELKLADRQLNKEQFLAQIVKHPILLQRPIVINGHRAIIARPPEIVLNIL